MTKLSSRILNEFHCEISERTINRLYESLDGISLEDIISHTYDYFRDSEPSMDWLNVLNSSPDFELNIKGKGTTYSNLPKEVCKLEKLGLIKLTSEPTGHWIDGYVGRIYTLKLSPEAIGFLRNEGESPGESNGELAVAKRKMESIDLVIKSMRIWAERMESSEKYETSDMLDRFIRKLSEALEKSL